MYKRFLMLACLLAALAVILGAFGAHSLKASVSGKWLNTFETGVRYHFYHTFGILIVGLIAKWHQDRWLKIAGWCFFIGILCFSGSLYLMTLNVANTNEVWSWLGPITPLGGLFFIIGWSMLFLSLSKIKDS